MEPQLTVSSFGPMLCHVSVRFNAGLVSHVHYTPVSAVPSHEVGHFRYMSISVHTISVHGFLVQSTSVH